MQHHRRPYIPPSRTPGKLRELFAVEEALIDEHYLSPRDDSFIYSHAQMSPQHLVLGGILLIAVPSPAVLEPQELVPDLLLPEQLPQCVLRKVEASLLS